MMIDIFAVLAKYNISFYFSAEQRYITASSSLPVVQAILDEAGFISTDYSLELN